MGQRGPRELPAMEEGVAEVGRSPMTGNGRMRAAIQARRQSGRRWLAAWVRALHPALAAHRALVPFVMFLAALIHDRDVVGRDHRRARDPRGGIDVAQLWL